MIVMSGKYTHSAGTACDLVAGVRQHSVLLGQEGFDLTPPNQWWGGLRSNVMTYQVPKNIRDEIGGRYILDQSPEGWYDIDPSQT